jgi:peptidoglycan/LPS O-acetylase OafA/YrhL
MNAPSATKPPHLHAIDLLRFVAAMGVVLCHWCFSPPHTIMEVSGAKYGVFGVQMFFLISGFVIVLSAQGQDLRSFVVARVTRLYPGFWICCTISALVAFADPLLGWPEYFYNMTMLPDPVYVKLINQSYWTLFIEAKFYLLIALLIICGALRRIEGVMWAWLSACALSTSFLANHLLMGRYAPFFVGGCTCFLLRQRPGWTRWALLLVSWVLAMKATVFEVSTNGGGLDPFTSCLLVTSFFIAMLAIARDWVVVPPLKAVATLGAISYPIYLLHQRIEIEFGWTTDSPALLLAAFVWLIVLSYVVHRWAELPFQRWMRARLARAAGSPHADQH